MSRRTRYTPEQKVKIVTACIDGENSIRGIARQYRISGGRIHEWIALYKARGKAAFLPQRQNNVYDEGIKNKAVKEYLEGAGSLAEISAKYGLRSSCQLQKWIEVYNICRAFPKENLWQPLLVTRDFLFPSCFLFHCLLDGMRFNPRLPVFVFCYFYRKNPGNAL